MQKNFTVIKNFAVSTIFTVKKGLMMKTLLSNLQLENDASNKKHEGWQLECYQKFREKILDKTFPCFYAGIAQQKGYMRILFLEDTTQRKSVQRALRGIRKYLRELQSLPQNVADMTVMVIFVKPDDKVLFLEEYEAQAYDFMTRLHFADRSPWPESIPADPNEPGFTYSLCGESLFVNVSTPANGRASRNLGDGLTFVLQPRIAFDRIAPNQETGNRIRKEIRMRAERYDGISVHPALGTYGTPDSFERDQYVLPDNNELRCPFHWGFKK